MVTEGDSVFSRFVSRSHHEVFESNSTNVYRFFIEDWFNLTFEN